MTYDGPWQTAPDVTISGVPYSWGGTGTHLLTVCIGDTTEAAYQGEGSVSSQTNTSYFPTRIYPSHGDGDDAWPATVAVNVWLFNPAHVPMYDAAVDWPAGAVALEYDPDDTPTLHWPVRFNFAGHPVVRFSDPDSGDAMPDPGDVAQVAKRLGVDDYFVTAWSATPDVPITFDVTGGWIQPSTLNDRGTVLASGSDGSVVLGDYTLGLADLDPSGFAVLWVGLNYMLLGEAPPYNLDSGAVPQIEYTYTPRRYRFRYDDPPFRPPLAHRQRRDGVAAAAPPLAHIGVAGAGRPPLAWLQNTP